MKNALAAIFGFIFVVSPMLLIRAEAICDSPPGLTIVNISNVSQLESAISALTSNREIRIAAGTYNLNTTLYLPQGISNVVIR
jgi:hypothetical protein